MQSAESLFGPQQMCLLSEPWQFGVIITRVQPKKENLDEPRVLLGDGARGTVQRSVQFRYRRRDIARMMKEFYLNKRMKDGLQVHDGRINYLAHRRPS